jgi:predicted ATPase
MSEFSSIIEGIPADSIAPKSPTGLSVISTSNDSISLTWAPNTELDLEGYFIFRNEVSDPIFWGIPIGIVSADNNEYLDIGLEENSTYFYKIAAFDEVPNNSSYSNTAKGTTLLDPRVPIIVSTITNITIFEDTIDNSSIELYKWFIDKNNDQLRFSCCINKHLNVTINQQNGKVTLIPEKNWCGLENVTFNCSDGLFNISYNITIIVLPVNDPPGPAEILKPEDNLEISENKALVLTGYCTDPDLPYGDELTYSWSSDLSGELGFGSELTDVKLKAGEHTITLMVSDSSGNSSYASINVMVQELEVESESIFNFGFILVSIIILIIVLLIIFFIYRTRITRIQNSDKTSKGATKGKIKSVPGSGSEGHRLVTTSDIYKYKKGEIIQTSDVKTLGTKTISTTPGTHLTETRQLRSSGKRGKQELLKFQSKLVGRDSELKVLREYISRTESGQGNTLLLYGEAGIGKTRLINELKNIALKRGFEVLTSNCMYESLSPYMPFMEALRTGGLDYLFSEETPRLEAVYLLSDSGMLISEVIRQDTKLNPVLFASMLTAVGNFVKESLSILSGEEKEGALNSLGFENYRILIESGSNINLAVILTGKENEYLISDLKVTMSKVTEDYGEVLKDWDGVVDKTTGIKDLLVPLIMSGKYDGTHLSEIDPKLRRNMLFNSVSTGLINKSKNQPVLLCMEDLHWADPSTLALIHYVTRNSSDSKLLIIGTYRPEELTTKDGISQPLMDTMHLMDREELLNKLELQRLTKECTDDMVTSLLGGQNINDNVRELIYRETEGNPLFMIELIKFLAEETIITHSKGTWHFVKKLEDLSLPPKIFNVIDRRLSRLDKKYREILEYASVIGESFSSSVLASAMSKSRIKRIKLLKALRELEQKYHLIFSIDVMYQFAHAKIKEVVYSKIPLELRMEYHEIIADSIKKLNKNDLNSVVETLAFHYNLSRKKSKAAIYLRRAAKKARANYSNTEAIRFYNSALGLVKDPQKMIEVYDSLGGIYDLMGDYDNSSESYNRAQNLADDPKMQVDLKTKLGLLYLKKSEFQKSIQQCTEALELVKNESLPESATTFETLGHTYHRMGDLDLALKNQRKSLEIYEKLKDQKGIATSLKNIGTVLLDRREHSNALKQFNKSLTIFQKLNNVDGIQQCYNNIGTLYFNQGEYDSAFEYYDKTLEIIQNSGDHSSIAILLLNLGQSQLQIGETNKAIKNLQKSLKISKENDLLMVTACNYWVMSEAYLKKNDLSRALDYCNKAYNTSKALGAKEIVAALKRVFGIIYGRQKKWNISIENFDDSIKLYQEIGNNRELGDTYYEYGLMLSSMDDSKSAKENLKRAVEIFRKLKLMSKRDKAVRAIESIGK